MEFGGHVVQPVSQSTWLTADDRRLCLSRLESCKLLGLERLHSLYGEVMVNGSTALQGHMVKGETH